MMTIRNSLIDKGKSVELKQKRKTKESKKSVSIILVEGTSLLTRKK